LAGERRGVPLYLGERALTDDADFVGVDCGGLLRSGHIVRCVRAFPLLFAASLRGAERREGPVALPRSSFAERVLRISELPASAHGARAQYSVARAVLDPGEDERTRESAVNSEK